MKQFVGSVILFFLVWVAANAQYVDWSRHFTGPGTATLNQVVRDASGNYYLTGGFNQTMDADPGAGVFTLTSSGSTDMFFIKLDVNGAFIWAFSIGGNWTESPLDLALDGQGNVLVMGKFSGTVDFNPSTTGVANHSSQGSPGVNDAVFVALYSPQGDYIRSFHLASSGNIYLYADFGLDAQGNLYLAGSFAGTLDFDPGPGSFLLTSPANIQDPFFCKISSSGNLYWAKKLSGGLSFTINDVVVQGNGFYISHYFNSRWDVNPSPTPADTFYITSRGSIDIGLLKLDTAGQFQWVRTIGSRGTDQGLRMEAKGSNGVVFCGNWTDTADFDPGPGTDLRIAKGGASDGFVMELDANGNRQWVQLISGSGTEYSQFLNINAQGETVVMGTFSVANLVLGTGPGSINLSPNGIDGYMAVFSSNGTFLRGAGFTGTGSQALSGCLFDNAGNPIVFGNFQNTLNLNPNPGNFQLTGTGNTDVFLARIVQSPVEVKPTLASTGLSVYPNPANAFIKVEGCTAADGPVFIIDVLGRVITSQPDPEALDVRPLPSGLYRIVGTKNQLRYSLPFVKE